MASTYSSNLKIELIGTGEQAGTWGNTTNTNLGTAVEEAIVGLGVANFASDADLTLTLTNTNSAQTARCFALRVTSSVSLTATRNLIVPTNLKSFIVNNVTTGGQSITIKTSAGTGVTIPNGGRTFVYVNGTNVVDVLTYTPTLTLDTALAITSGGTGATTASGARTNLGLGTISTQNANSVAITGGSIDGVAIGGTTTAAGNFTTLTTSSTVTLNGGTANGVLYLNGSKVATSGSALQYDGSIFYVVGAGGQRTTDAASANGFEVVPSSTNNILSYNRTSAAYLPIRWRAGVQSWEVDNTEQMRLTSTGLGIGTTSPARKLDVNGPARIGGAAGVGYIGFSSTVAFDTSAIGCAVTTGFGDSLGLAVQNATGVMTFATNSTERMRLDTSGNLGLGVTPSAWGSAFKALQINGGAAIMGDAANAYISGNAYYNGTNWVYKTTNPAVRFDLENGAHKWYIAPSGTAGNAISFTQAMTLDASGNLGVGTTSPATRLDVASSGSGVRTALNIRNDSDTLGVVGAAIHMGYASPSANYGTRIVNYGNPAADYAGTLTFERGNGSGYTESMRLDSSGNLGLGITPSAWGGSYKAIQIPTGQFASTPAGAAVSFNQYYDGTNYKYIATGSASMLAQDGTFKWFTAPSGTAGNTISFTQAMTLDASGRLAIGASSASYTLDVSAASGGTFRVYDSSDVGRGLEILAGSSASGVSTIQTNTSTRALVFGTNSTERMRLDSSGNLGLGVTPSAWISNRRVVSTGGVAVGTFNSATGIGEITFNAFVNSSAEWRYQTAAPAAVFDFNNTSSGGFAWRIAPTGTAGAAISFTQAMTLDTSGNLLVGTTTTAFDQFGLKYRADLGTLLNTSNNNPGLLVNRQGSTGGLIDFYSANTAVGSISTNGTNTAYNTSSDYRLKNITGPITTSGDYIDSLNPVEGTWKADGSTFVGLIAHEVQEVSRTQVATGEKDGAEMQAMDYSNSELIANLIAEVQSLRKRLAAAGIA